MNELTKFLVEGILNEETEKAVALFGGGFKPPTKGHLDVVNQGIKQNPEVSEIKILVGGGTRNGFTQDQSVKIWNLYNDIGFIKKPATIIPVSSPFTYYKNYLKDNPDNKVYVFIGSRPGEEKDQFDVKQRSEFVKKYSDNVIPVEVSTGGGVSGTLARELFKTDIDGFRNMFPENLLDQDFKKILDILNNKSTDNTRKSTPKATEPLSPLNEEKMSMDDFNLVGAVLRDKNKAEKIHKLLLQMFPKQKELLDYNYKNDSYAEFKRVIFHIDKYNIEGPKLIQHTELKLDPEVYKERDRKYEEYAEGKIKKYFRDSDSDPRTLDLSKVPPITIDSEGEVADGNHRAFLAIKQQKPLKAYQIVNAKNDHPNVEKILNIVGRKKQEENIDPKSQAKHKGKSAPFGSAYEPLNENATYSSKIDYKQQIKNLTKHMIKKGMNILPLPKVIFKHGDQENASQFLGKTAYYSPSDMTVVLYTEGRHPKDIVRSFAHEMVHHIQNLEDRLGGINTTNTQEDDNLNDIEREAYTKGNMTFRNWTDSLDGEEVTSLNEDLTKNSNQIYHWTSYSACKKIIESNKLKSNKSSQFFEYDESRDLPDYKNVVFFTVEGERFVDEENSNQCILVVDKSKLSKDYKVISYGDPYEETVVYTNDSSMPILPYLKGVILMNTLQKSAVKKMVEFLESKSIPYEINDNLERKVKDKKAKLPSLKKELINKLKLKYPNGFIGYLNTPLLPYQTLEYFKNNSIYSYPNITINKPGEYGEKNKFQVKFKIEPQNLEKYINWYMYSFDFIEDLINMDNYEGEELYLKGNIPIDVETLNEKIVGEKIECDNCGWSWNIVDGGDDLYICHKCDHDNKPENGDPFGLKAYARELMEDFNIEEIKPAAKSLEEQKEVRIFTTNCGCDKT